MTGAAYIEQLSRHVRQGIDKSAQNSCYLIKRRIYSVTKSELDHSFIKQGAKKLVEEARVNFWAS